MNVDQTHDELCTCGATCQDIGGGRCRYEKANQNTAHKTPAPLPTDGAADEMVEEACRNICKLTGEKEPDRLVYAGQTLGSVPAWRLNEKIARAALDSFIAHPPKPQPNTRNGSDG